VAGRHSPAGQQAREHVRAAIRDVHSTFPDISFTIEDFAGHGDKIWVPVRARGTASGPFFGLAQQRVAQPELHRALTSHQ
jgi:predicted ester cyclase